MKKKVIFIGYDGLMYEMVDRFVKEGIMPNFAKLIKNGVFSRSLPSPPTDTPTNWTSLATGAFTGTHGNNTFGVHFPGEPLEKVHLFGANIFPRYAGHWKKQEALNKLSEAEYVWQAAERAGKKCILVNYPGGWPPNIKKGITVDGTGPYSSILSRLSFPNVFSTQASLKGQCNQLEIVKAKDWKNLPESLSDAIETAIVISGEGDLAFKDGQWNLKEGAKNPKVEPGLFYNILIINSKGIGYDKIILCRGKDLRKKVTSLSAGEQSKWLRDEFQTQFGKFKAKFKLRLLELSQDGKNLRIFRTTIFNTGEWAHPKHIANELIDDLLKKGKDFESDGTKDDVPKACPLCQVYESIAEQGIGLAMTAKYLANKYPWDLLFIQLHAPDGLNHQKLNEICPQWKEYVPEEADKAWKEFHSQYAVFDKFLGDVVCDCADKNTMVVVVSDHSAVPTFRRVWLPKFFEEAGLTAYKPDPEKRPGFLSDDWKFDKESPSYVLDWEKAKVFVGGNPFAQNIWVNLKGREVNGIVEPGKEYEEIVQKSIDTLYSIRDPENGECPIELALRKEDADCLGQWGRRAGDIIFFFKPPYTEVVGAHSFTPISEKVYRSSGFFDVKRGGGMQGIHHVFLPSAKFAGCSAGAVFIASGPGIKKGYGRIAPLWTTDVVPTICHWLGIPVPKQCEGKAPLDIFK